MDAKPNSSFAQISGFLNTNWRHYTDFKHVFGGAKCPPTRKLPAYSAAVRLILCAVCAHIAHPAHKMRTGAESLGDLALPPNFNALCAQFRETPKLQSVAT
jgi:hypothetical protein